MKLKLNSVSFTGKVSNLRVTDKCTYVLITNEVAREFRTEYPIVLRNEDFKELNITLEQYVAVLNVPLGIENGRYRFRVAKPSQIWRIAPRENTEAFGRATFSGIISGIDETKDAYVLHVVQDTKAMKAEFRLVVAKQLYQDIPAITFEDEVLVSNAQSYQKDGIFHFRITTGHQLKLIKRNNPDKGVVQAKDRFI